MRTLITRAQTWVATRKHHEDGANMAEYGLLVTFIAMVAVGGVTAFGLDVTALFPEDLLP